MSAMPLGNNEQLWFRSTRFAIEPGEEEATNPFRYGRQLATWIAAKFAEAGYAVGEATAEDWGWSVPIATRPFTLFIGCGNVHSPAFDDAAATDSPGFTPDGAAMTWTCFVGTDVRIVSLFFLRRLLGKVTTQPAVDAAFATLGRVLRDDPAIELVDEP